MRMEQLEYFIYLAKGKNMQAAANHFFTSPQVVSSSIKKLEKELNTTLFVRSAKGATLTEDGYDMLPYIENILENYNYLKNNYMQKKSVVPSSVIKILSSSGTIALFADMFNNYIFDSSHKLILQTFSTKKVNKTLLQPNSYDIIATVATDTEKQAFENNYYIATEYFVHLILQQPAKLWCNKNFQGVKNGIISLSDLDKIPLVNHAKEDEPNSEDRPIFELENNMNINYLYNVNDIKYAIKLLKNNKACLISPEYYINSILSVDEKKDLMAIDFKENMNRNILLFERKKSHIGQFIENIKQTMHE